MNKCQEVLALLYLARVSLDKLAGIAIKHKRGEPTILDGLSDEIPHDTAVTMLLTSVVTECSANDFFFEPVPTPKGDTN